MNAAGAALLNGLAAGLLHPLIVPAHVLALAGLGLMIGQQSRRRIPLTAFVLGLVGGLLALALAVGETPASTVLLMATMVTGLTAAVGWPVPVMIAAPLAVVVGVSLGLDSPPRAAAVHTANAALVGTALAAFAMVALIASIATRLRPGWLHIGLRVLGSWIAASAILVLALRLAR